MTCQHHHARKSAEHGVHTLVVTPDVLIAEALRAAPLKYALRDIVSIGY